MKQIKYSLAAPLIAVLIGHTFLTGCSEPQTAEKVLRPVKHIKVESGQNLLRERVFSGTTQAAQEVDLSFKVSGTVKQIAVETGDKVSRADVIAQLDPVTYQLELQQANAAVAQSNANRRSAESEYQRTRQLYTNDNASQNDLDTALANAESAKAALDSDTQNSQLAELNLEYTNLIVDADCSVISVDVEENENVTQGQTIAQLNCGDNWEVLISVPESLIASFKRGMKSNVVFSSLPNQVFTGVVTEVGIGSSKSSTFPVTISLDSPPENIRSNLAAEVTTVFSPSSSDSQSIHIPISALVNDQSGKFVYVMESTDEPGAAVLKKRYVEIGEVSSLGLQINVGLVAGDRVVVAGQINVRENMLVRDQ